MKTGIISTYFPSAGGVATYTKYLFEKLSTIDSEVFVLADFVDQPVNDPQRVLRCWNRDRRFVSQILKTVKQENFKIIHLQQELHLFGSKLNALLLPYLMLRLKLMGVKVIITLHGVVPIHKVDAGFLQENGYFGNAYIIKNLIRILYSFIALFADTVIVHEAKFQEYLKAYWVAQKKIRVIGHGIKDQKLIDQKIAKDKFGLDDKFTFLSFGYVTGYKGLELLISALKAMPEDDFNFIVVGSRHPRLKDEPAYQKYYQSIEDYFKNDRRCRFFDYAPEEEINYYFASSDCAVFPYTVQMSSSGPMALAIANEILVLGSEAFEGFLTKDLLFANNQESLVALMRRAKQGQLESYRAFIKAKKQELSWQEIAKQTQKLY